MSSVTSVGGRAGASVLASKAARVLDRLWLPLICALPALFYFPFLNEPFDNDEGAYATMARLLLHGGVPYRDLFDHKPPMVYAYYALGFRLFGESLVAPRLMAVLAWSLTSALAYVEGRLVWSRRRGLVASALVASSSSFMFLQPNANTEVFMLPALVASLVALTRWQQTGDRRLLFLAGALGGVAALTKQVAVWNLFGFALFVFVWRWRAGQWRYALADVPVLAAGSLAVLAVVLAPFALTGALGDFYYANITYNRLYSSVLTSGERVDFLRNAVYSMLALSGLLCITLLGLLEMRRRPKLSYDYLLLTSMAAAFGGVITSGFNFPHYFVTLLPFMALLSTPFVEKGLFPSRRDLLAPVLLSAAVMVAAALGSRAYLPASPEARHRVKFPKDWENQNQAAAVGRFIADHTAPADLVYNYGHQTEIYFYADRRPAIRFMYDRPFWIDGSTFGEAMTELEAARPVLIVDSVLAESNVSWEQAHPAALAAFLAENYDDLGKLDFAEVYRLKGSANPVASAGSGR